VILKHFSTSEIKCCKIKSCLSACNSLAVSEGVSTEFNIGVVCFVGSILAIYIMFQYVKINTEIVMYIYGYFLFVSQTKLPGICLSSAHF
jgi:hypothetical protein